MIFTFRELIVVGVGLCRGFDMHVILRRGDFVYCFGMGVLAGREGCWWVVFLRGLYLVFWSYVRFEDATDLLQTLMMLQDTHVLGL